MYISIVLLLRVCLTALSLVLGALALRTWQRRRRAPEAPIVAALIASAAIYCFGYAQELAQTTLAGAASWLQVEYLGVPWIPALWLLGARRHSGLRTHLGWLFAVPVATFVAEQTDSLHWLQAKSMELLRHGPFWVLKLHSGPAAWLNLAYLNVALLYGAWLYIARPRRARRAGMRTAVLVGSSLIPWAGHLVYLAGWSPWGLDLAPMMLGVSVVLAHLAVFRFGVFDLMPTARSLVFHNMRDAVIVSDLRHRLADFNPAAHDLIPCLVGAEPGEDLACVLREMPELAKALLGPEGTRRIELDCGGEMQQFEVRVFPLCHDGYRSGSAAILANVAAQVRLMDELRRTAQTDALTGVANRRCFEANIQRESARCARHGEPFSVALVDIDRFKSVNDCMGHHVGDGVLVIVTDRILRCLRESDLLSRLGGDEFAILLPRIGAKGAMEAAERIRAAVAVNAMDAGGAPLRTTVSVGVATYDGFEEADWAELLRQADMALYEAKAMGRNRVAGWEQLRERRLDRSA
jgi:diguanylate cyclase (GGDEF)-like protein